jgi:SAM-dependent methyltransferase
LQEKPAMKLILPNIVGKNILDLGCGYGESCKFFIENGANRVVGVDISERMLDVARTDNDSKEIEYIRLDMKEIATISERFDLIYSSMAFHYIDDFDELLKSINHLLLDDGILLFSQEHPLSTSNKGDDYWTMEGEQYKHYNLSYYMDSGKRQNAWLVDNVMKYHRTFSELLNSLIGSGFLIEKVDEPKATDEHIILVPKMQKDIHKPNFLIIRAKKIR